MNKLKRSRPGEINIWLAELLHLSGDDECSFV